MASAIPPTPLSPSVGARRKGAKALPRLPLSAFTPPNTGSSEAFPLPPSPSTLQPEELVDAYVIAPDGDLSEWKAQAGETLRRKTKGVVLALPQKEPAEVEKILAKYVVPDAYTRRSTCSCRPDHLPVVSDQDHSMSLL